jgi:hypothetical protein
MYDGIIDLLVKIWEAVLIPFIAGELDGGEKTSMYDFSCL